MDLMTVIGLISGLGLIVYGIVSGSGVLMSFYDFPSIVIVFGGTIATTVMSLDKNDIKGIGKIAKNAFVKKAVPYKETISEIIDLANIARKEGLLALEESSRRVADPFMQKGLMLIVDGTDPTLVKEILEDEISFIEARHQKGAGVFDAMAQLAPAMGMLGTLIGLINMLKNLDDPSSLGAGMAVALVTTFYGSIIANMICIPISNKLKLRSSGEIIIKEMIITGLVAIQAGENPRIIEERLNSFLPRTFDGKSGAGRDRGERGYGTKEEV